MKCCLTNAAPFCNPPKEAHMHMCTAFTIVYWRIVFLYLISSKWRLLYWAWMGIGHTWHLMLHTLSEEEKGRLIYDSELRRAGGCCDAGPFPFLWRLLLSSIFKLYTWTAEEWVSEEWLKIPPRFHLFRPILKPVWRKQWSLLEDLVPPPPSVKPWNTELLMSVRTHWEIKAPSLISGCFGSVPKVTVNLAKVSDELTNLLKKRPSLIPTQSIWLLG